MTNPRTQKIGELLVKARVIDELQLRSALATHENWGGRFSHVVAEMGLAAEEKIVDTLAKALNMQRIRLGNLQKDQSAMNKLDVKFCEDKGIFPVQMRDGGKVIVIAMSDPTDLDSIDEVGRKVRARVTAFIAGEREIKNAIDRHYKGLDPSSTPQPPRGATLRPTSAEEDGEFKIVDMSGKTVMKKLSDIVDPALAAQEQAPRTAPPTFPAGGAEGSGASASDLLDDILGGGAPIAPALSPEDLVRLQTVSQNQEKSAKILKVVRELLNEKGYKV